jgi:hypothetical protein
MKVIIHLETDIKRPGVLTAKYEIPRNENQEEYQNMYDSIQKNKEDFTNSSMSKVKQIAIENVERSFEKIAKL